jgi:hypothetical protein
MYVISNRYKGNGFFVPLSDCVFRFFVIYRNKNTLTPPSVLLSRRGGAGYSTGVVSKVLFIPD